VQDNKEQRALGAGETEGKGRRVSSAGVESTSAVPDAVDMAAQLAVTFALRVMSRHTFPETPVKRRFFTCAIFGAAGAALAALRAGQRGSSHRSFQREAGALLRQAAVGAAASDVGSTAWKRFVAPRLHAVETT